MNEVKDYRGPDNDAPEGLWRRVWTKPRMGVDTVAIDPYSSKDFVKATNKKGVVGDMWDRSAELAAKRKDKEGVDPIQEQFYKDYSKRRKGRKHPTQAREESVKKLAAKGIRIDFGED